MDNLFLKLPRDLQWEILTEFVGTHVVRNGKLMRKMSLDINTAQYKYTIRDRPCYGWLYKRFKDEDNTRVCARFPSNESHMMFWRDPNTDDTIILCRKSAELDSLWDKLCEAQFTTIVLENLDLQPFIKHTYPSYPFTDKKKRIPLTR